MRTFAGTAIYFPPECFKKQSYVDWRADTWALGILLFDMVKGGVPFQDDTEIVGASLQFSEHTTVSCRPLHQWMLEKDEYLRPTLMEMRQHPWITMAAPEGPNLLGALAMESKNDNQSLITSSCSVSDIFEFF